MDAPYSRVLFVALHSRIDLGTAYSHAAVLAGNASVVAKRGGRLSTSSYRSQSILIPRNYSNPPRQLGVTYSHLWSKIGTDSGLSITPMQRSGI